MRETGKTKPQLLSGNCVESCRQSQTLKEIKNFSTTQATPKKNNLKWRKTEGKETPTLLGLGNAGSHFRSRRDNVSLPSSGHVKKCSGASKEEQAIMKTPL